MAQSLNDTFIVEESNIKDSVFSKDSLVVSDSTRSLLTPLYASDYETGSRSSRRSSSSSTSSTSSSSFSSSGSSDGSSSTSYAKFEKRKTACIKTAICKASNQDRIRGTWKPPVHKGSTGNDIISKNRKVLTKSWEEWVIEKAVHDLKKLQIKRELRQKKALEKRKQKEEERQKHQKAVENRERWLIEKNYELEKRMKEEAAQREYESLKEKQKRELIENKSKIAYENWLRDKSEVLKQQKLKEKERKVELREKAIERQRVNDEAYRNWLRENRRKKKDRKNSSDKHESSFEDCYKKIIGESPSYVNPVPWRGVLDDVKQKGLLKKSRERTEFQSPPLLWRDYEARISQTELKPEKGRATSSRMRPRL